MSTDRKTNWTGGCGSANLSSMLHGMRPRGRRAVRRRTRSSDPLALPAMRADRRYRQLELEMLASWLRYQTAYTALVDRPLGDARAVVRRRDRLAAALRRRDAAEAAIAQRQREILEAIEVQRCDGPEARSA